MESALWYSYLGILKSWTFWILFALMILIASDITTHNIYLLISLSRTCIYINARSNPSENPGSKLHYYAKKSHVQQANDVKSCCNYCSSHQNHEVAMHS